MNRSALPGTVLVPKRWIVFRPRWSWSVKVKIGATVNSSPFFCTCTRLPLWEFFFFFYEQFSYRDLVRKKSRIRPCNVERFTWKLQFYVRLHPSLIKIWLYEIQYLVSESMGDGKRKDRKPFWMGSVSVFTCIFKWTRFFT